MINVSRATAAGIGFFEDIDVTVVVEVGADDTAAGVAGIETETRAWSLNAPLTSSYTKARLRSSV